VYSSTDFYPQVVWILLTSSGQLYMLLALVVAYWGTGCLYTNIYLVTIKIADTCLFWPIYIASLPVGTESIEALECPLRKTPTHLTS
jgi:hypothetical protein